MRSKWTNRASVKGYIFNHTLKERVAGENAKNPGQKYIYGQIDIATDDTGANVVTVNFNYVTPTYKSGSENRTYNMLSNLIDSCRKMSELPDNEKTTATQISIDGQIESNDFLGSDGNMVSRQCIRGSFCNPMKTSEEPQAVFEADMLILATEEKEFDDSNYLELKGYVFDFRGGIIPVTFRVYNQNGIKYFEKLDISVDDPCLTTVHGNLESRVITKQETEEVAWGDENVKVSTRSIKAWNILGSAKETMEFDTEDTITWDELKAAKTARDDYLAEQKKRAIESRTHQKMNSFSTGSAAPKKTNGFRF